MLAYYDFNSTNDTQLTDYSGNENHGVLTNFNLTNNDLTFDGVNDYVNLGDIGLNSAQNHSFSAWIYLNSNWSTPCQIIGGRRGDVTSFGISNARKLECKEDDETLNGLTKIPTEEWVHVVYVFLYLGKNDSAQYCYINGVLDNSRVISDYVDNWNVTSTWIGWESRFNSSFRGNINNIGVWNRSLSFLEINDLYNDSYGLSFDKMVDSVPFYNYFIISFVAFFSYFAGLINSYQTILIILAIICGFFTFYFNRETLEKGVEDEQLAEESAEIKRAKDFDKKFPFFTKFNISYGIKSAWTKHKYLLAIIKALIIPIIWIARIPYTLTKWCYKEEWKNVIILLLVAFCFLFFGMHHLGQFMSVDEPKWVNIRVPQLYDALSSGEWEKTYINDKPGVLPSLLSGVVNFFLDHDYYKSKPLEYEYYLFWWRLPILLFNFIMLFFIYHFVKKLSGKNYSLLITGLIALNPILIGISQIVNPDATLWSVSFLSFINFFLYLKLNNKKYIYYSGIFFGLGLISKYFISIFYVMFFLIIYLEYLVKKISINKFYNRCLDLGLLYLISVVVYTLLFPATWVNPKLILRGTVEAGILTPGIKYILIFIFLVFFELIVFKGKITNYFRNKLNIGLMGIFLFSLILFLIFITLIINVIFNNLFFDFNQYFLNHEIKITNIIDNIISSFYCMFFSLTLPLILVVFFFFIIFLKKNELIKNNKLLILSCFIFIFLFIFGSSLGGFVVLIRYQVMLYPLFAILVSFFVFSIYKSKKIIVFILTFSIISLFFYTPYFFHYTNFLNIQNYIITEAWGIGGYELAQNMNSLPNSENITIWVDREGFSEFFIGKSYWRGVNNPFNESYNIEYLILTKGGEKIFTNALINYNTGKRNLYARVSGETPILEYYKKEPLFEVCINNNTNNCIRTVKIEK
ncbi:MAG: LamG-like jellyroll fold domain-containing protein [Candidatus Nanoarchaeia archaeon]